MTNEHPNITAKGVKGNRARIASRREERLRKEAEALARSEAAAKVRQERRNYVAQKEAGTLPTPNPDSIKSIDDFGGYDINGNPL
jgi:hypothetical protein